MTGTEAAAAVLDVVSSAVALAHSLSLLVVFVGVVYFGGDLGGTRKRDRLVSAAGPIAHFTIWPYRVVIGLYGLGCALDGDAWGTLWHAAFLALHVWAFHDRDKWQRRRRRATAKVREVGGRLTVVPVPHGAPA